MRRELPVRRQGMQVRRQPIRRSSPRLLKTQMYALAVMLLCAFSAAALAASPAVAARRLEVHGARFTGAAIVGQLVDLESSPNLFALRTDRIVARLAGLPAVKSARVEVALPDTIVVILQERQPRLVWVVGRTRYVVDENGLLFGVVDGAGNPVLAASLEQLASPGLETPGSIAEPSGEVAETSSPVEAASPTAKTAATPKRPPTKSPPPTPSKAPASSPSAGETLPEALGSETPAGSPVATSLPPPSLDPVPAPNAAATAGPGAVSLPVVHDRRLLDATLALGDLVDPIALDAGYRLASLSPAEVGSTSGSMDVVLDDDHGFTLAAPSRGWVAEFGFYTRTLRKVSVIPGQVRDLRSVLLWAGEDRVAWVWLMSDISDSHIIDYLPR